MIFSPSGEQIVATLEGAPAGLTITAHLSDGDEVLPNLITVTPVLDGQGDPLPAYEGSVTLPASLPVIIQWFQDVNGVPTQVGAEIITEPMNTLEPNTWTPTPEEVADLLYNRTKDRGGRYDGVFNTTTNPTRDRVLRLISAAQGHVASDIGITNMSDTLMLNARHMTVIYTAMLVELSSYAEQVTRDISPYKELRKLYEASLTQLEDQTKPGTGYGAEDSQGNPNYHFDGFATGYKAW